MSLTRPGRRHRSPKDAPQGGRGRLRHGRPRACTGHQHAGPRQVRPRCPYTLPLTFWVRGGGPAKRKPSLVVRQPFDMGTPEILSTSPARAQDDERQPLLKRSELTSFYARVRLDAWKSTTRGWHELPGPRATNRMRDRRAPSDRLRHCMSSSRPIERLAIDPYVHQQRQEHEGTAIENDAFSPLNRLIVVEARGCNAMASKAVIKRYVRLRTSPHAQLIGSPRSLPTRAI
jgi:hypothetical protein